MPAAPRRTAQVPTGGALTGRAQAGVVMVGADRRVLMAGSTADRLGFRRRSRTRPDEGMRKTQRAFDALGHARG